MDTNTKSDGISKIKNQKEHESFLITPEEIQQLPLSFINSLSHEDHFLLFKVVAKEHNRGSNLLDDKFIILVNSLLKSPLIKDVVLFLVNDNSEYMHNLHKKSSTKKKTKTPILTSLQLFKRLGGSDHMLPPMSARERATARYKNSIYLQGQDFNHHRRHPPHSDPLPHLNLSPRFKTKGFTDFKFISALRAKASIVLDDGIDAMRESLCRSFCVTSELWTDMDDYYERENDSPTVFSNEARMDSSASAALVTLASETQLSVKKHSLSAERIKKSMKYVAGGAAGGDDEMCPLESVIRLHQKAPHHNINNIFDQEDGLTIEFLYDSGEEEEEEGIYRYQRVCTSSLRSDSSSEDDSVFIFNDKSSSVTKKEKAGQISRSTRKLLQQTRKQLKETEDIFNELDGREQNFAKIKRLKDQLRTDGTKITYNGMSGYFKQQLAQQRLLIKERFNDAIDGHKELYFNVSYE